MGQVSPGVLWAEPGGDGQNWGQASWWLPKWGLVSLDFGARPVWLETGVVSLASPQARGLCSQAGGQGHPGASLAPRSPCSDP